MAEAFFFIGMPYLALGFLIVGSIYRYRANRFGYSSLSSQFLEGNWLMWGSLPWHVGIVVVLAGHVIPFLIPGLWQSITPYGPFLLVVETIGMAAALLAAIGLATLLLRRITSSKVQAVTTFADLAVVALLLFQVLLGISVATGYRWGAVWSVNTTTPYLWSLLTLQPDPALVTGLPPVVRLHIILAWTLLLLVPFTRLVHVFSVPIAYLWRAPQQVVWTSERRLEAKPRAEYKIEEGRRLFLRGALAGGLAATLLGVGVLDKLINFFKGPLIAPDEEAELLRKKVNRLELAAQQRDLELERMSREYIRVARLNELSPKDGRYFTDYEMRPALAFRDASGLPLLISAKCTHLGCTVGSTLDANGKILCPCHISYFDVRTGLPNPGSPAKTPLAHLGWVLMDDAGKLVSSQGPDGAAEGKPDMSKLDTYTVFIAKQFEEKA